MDTCLEEMEIGRKKVTNIFFADDCPVILSEKKNITEKASKLYNILGKFQKKFGMKINISKSQLITNMSTLPHTLKLFKLVEPDIVVGNPISFRDTVAENIERVNKNIYGSIQEIGKYRLTILDRIKCWNMVVIPRVNHILRSTAYN
uniref:Putative LOC101743068 [Bombyx mori] n=1 Tax=Lepeophtheirus salmonis TaxID=72036 RepID=A0A0K2U9T1_LEPSM